MKKNLSALVTGGLGYIGLATTRHLLQKGFRVVFADLPPRKKSEAMVELEEKSAIFTPCDITQDEEVRNLLDGVVTHFGSLDLVVNCGGKMNSVMISRTNPDPNLKNLTNEIIDMNVKGTFHVIQNAFPVLLKNNADVDGMRGLIINTSGYQAYDGQLGQSLAAAAFGAVASMTLPLAREFGSFGIRVMAIAPGVMDTPDLCHLPPKMIKLMEACTPCPKRLGQPEEFASLVSHIYENKFLNGEVIRLDGSLRTYLQ